MSRNIMKLPRPRELATRQSRAIDVFNKAVADQRAGKSGEAITGYRNAIALQPDLVCAYSNLGLLLLGMGKHQEADACYATALQHCPTDAEVLNNLGILRKAQGNVLGAIECYRKALDSRPEFVAACNNLGAAFDDMGKRDEALVCYRRALSIDPNFAECHNNIGVVLKRKGNLAEAKANFERAIACKPDYAEAYCNLAAIYRAWGKIEEMLPYYRKAVECKPNAADLHSTLLFSLNCVPNLEPAEVSREHRKWAAIHAPASQAQRAHRNDTDPDRPLRVGYISPDFRDHSVAFFLEPILGAHNPKNVELIAYAEVKKPDEVTKRMKAKFSVWNNTSGMSNETLAKLIHNDKVDILVDLAGHTADNRLILLAQKPAPIQVTYLGYPNTTGLSAVDYRLTDAAADPAEHQALNTEELVRLPTGFLCYAPSPDAPGVGPLPASVKGHITFGSFNAVHKLNPATIAVWSKILGALPTSKLMLKSSTFNDETTRECCLKQFETNGIDRRRVQVLAWEQSRSNHYGIYNEIDIALDPFPYNGTTTTCEGMWMGVPTLTLTGNNHVSRVGGSLLQRVGLDQFIAATPQEYVDKAIAITADLEALARVRLNLRERMAASPLCDAANFTATLEAAYRAMWKRWCAEQRGEADPGTVDAQLEQNPPVRMAPAFKNPILKLDLPAKASEPGSPNVPEAAVEILRSKGGMRAIGRLAETAILADAMARQGHNELAFQYAQQGLAYVRRGQFQDGIPPALLESWQAPTPEGMLLRQCLAYSNHSTFLARKKSQEWLMAWAKLEPENPEPFLRFGLLFALIAVESGLPVPKTALDALQHAQRFATDERPAIALALLSGELKEMAAPYDGTAIFLRPDIRAFSTFVLLEQGDWFEVELDLFRLLLRPGENVLDLGSNIGVYALSAAQRVGENGKVVAVEEDETTFRLLEKSAKLQPRLSAKNVKLSDLNLDALLKSEGVEQLDMLKVSFDARAALLGENATLAMKGSPIIVYEIRDGEKLDLSFAAELQKHGFNSFVYHASQRALRLYRENMELEDSVINLVALKPESLGRLGDILRLI